MSAPLTTSNPFSQGIFNAVKGVTGLFQDYNKVTDVKGGGPEGGTGDEYKDSFDEKKIQELVKAWKASYSIYYGDIEGSQKISYDYWIGQQKVDTMEAIDGHNVVDNLLFEAVETFLPIANRANPDPLVMSRDQQLASSVKNALVDWADTQKLKMKLKRGTRHWVLNRLGCWKMSFDAQTGQIELTVVNPKHLILDKDGHVDEAGFFTGEYIGEKRKASVARLCEMFPNKEQEIKNIGKGKPAMKLEYTEWWYRNTDVFYTLDATNTVLGKFKNPHWNYDVREELNPETGELVSESVAGRNHFPLMRAPYVFLSIFSTGDKPHDDTSLILQNIPLQDMINKRYRQIDKNADSQNNGALASGSSFTKEQAAEAASFLRKGGTVWVPNGDVNMAWKRDAAPPLPGDVYNQLADSRQELRNIFGTAGSTPEGLESQQTVRGKIMMKDSDSSRIGGGVTEHIEQAADSIYNWVVQMVYVHYDEPHEFPAMGLDGVQEIMSLSNSSLVERVRVTVKEGSLIPKDPLTQRNEAFDLWEGNAIGLVELYKKLEFPDPIESAKQTLIWQQIAQGLLPPQILFPDFPSPMVSDGPVGVGTKAVDENNSVDEISTTPPGEPVSMQEQSLLQSVPM